MPDFATLKWILQQRRVFWLFARAARDHWQVLWAIAQAAKEVGQLELVDRACAMVLRANPEFWFARELPKHARGYYAQHDQDQVVETFFQTHPPKRRIFVEVGAFDGIHYSNVRRLWERYQWTGVCIEPVQENYEKLCAAYRRTPVKCVRAAVANWEGEAEIHVSSYPHLPDWGSDVATLLTDERDRWQQYSPHWRTESVPVRKLTSILDEMNIMDMDFLSVDTEGYDLEVLQSLDFTRFRPQLVLVEYGQERDQIVGYLAERGYRLWRDDGQDVFMALQSGDLPLPKKMEVPSP